jgi:hypothetical protein
MNNISSAVAEFRKKKRYIEWFKKKYYIVDIADYIKKLSGGKISILASDNPNISQKELLLLEKEPGGCLIWRNPNMDDPKKILITNTNSSYFRDHYLREMRAYSSNINITKDIILNYRHLIDLYRICSNESISIEFLIEHFYSTIISDINLIRNIAERKDIKRKHMFMFLDAVIDAINEEIEIGGGVDKKTIEQTLEGFAKNEVLLWEDIECRPDVLWPYKCLTFMKTITLDVIRSRPDIRWNFEEILLKPGITWKFIKEHTKKGALLFVELQKCINAWEIHKSSFHGDIKKKSTTVSAKYENSINDPSQCYELSILSSRTLKNIMKSGIFPIKKAKSLPHILRNKYITYHPNYKADVYFYETDPISIILHPNLYFEQVVWYNRDILSQKVINHDIYSAFCTRSEWSDVTLNTVLRYPNLRWDIDSLLKNNNIHASRLLSPNVMNRISFSYNDRINGLYDDVVFNKHYNISVSNRKYIVVRKLYFFPKDVANLTISYIGFE